jgi:dihydroorotate dehydrogenase (NAD+) catalytic subunit
MPTWNLTKDFDWNYSNGPLLNDIRSEPLPQLRPVPFLSWQLNSPLGIAAGPLLNSKFVKAYARLGYSLLTYKSVRSCAWQAHPEPILTALRPDSRINLLTSKPLIADSEVIWSSSNELSSANSVGLPSREPEKWREDVRYARESLAQGQVLVVSVVGTSKVGGTKEQLAEDFATCAKWAKEAGADMIELNLSCPNVHSPESEVYLDPKASSLVVQAARAKIGQIPLSAKLGYYSDIETMHNVLESIVESIDALTLVNAIKWPVVDSNGLVYFPGEGREYAGAGGAAIRDLAKDNIQKSIEFLKKQKRTDIPVIAVGGVTQPEHVQKYLELGAKAVNIASTAIWRPSFSHDYYDYVRFRDECPGDCNW